MANGAILRGEVYWVCVDDSVGSEQQTGRPALIISGDKANEKRNTVIVAYLTTGGFGNFSTVTVNYCGKPERVLCDQVRTLDKQRLTRYMGKLSEAEMRRVSGGLAICMCLRTDGVCEDVFDRDESEELISLKAECEMWKRGYDMVMSQLVETKVAAELAQRMSKRMVVEVEEPPVVAVVEETPVVNPEPPKQPELPKEPEQEQELVEINTCTAEDLKRCGCTPVVIENIIRDRPYMALTDLRTVDGVTSVAYGILKHKLCCVPVKVEQKTEEKEPETVVEPEAPVVEEPVVVAPEQPVLVIEKVNINTATIKEMAAHLGISTFYPNKISAHRNKNGRFVDLEELKMVEGLPKDFYERYADKCTIGEPEPPKQLDPVVEESEKKPETVGEKVNINTATAQEISDALGLSKTVCFSITGHRARNGLYKSIEELRQVPRFLESHWEKYKDMVTVGEGSEPDEEAPKKLNINTASLRELMAVGFEKRAAALIVNERRKFGRFRDVEDLSAIPEISGKILRKLRGKLEV